MERKESEKRRKKRTRGKGAGVGRVIAGCLAAVMLLLVAGAAFLTKMMTCLAGIEQITDLEEKVTLEEVMHLLKRRICLHAIAAGISDMCSLSTGTGNLMTVFGINSIKFFEEDADIIIVRKFLGGGVKIYRK